MIFTGKLSTTGLCRDNFVTECEYRMNEREYILSLARSRTAGQPADVLMAMGDDCAVVRKCGGTVTLLSMDTMVEGVHFDRTFHPPELLGRKVVSVNVSDIAAMGGSPTLVLLSAGLPPGFDADWVQAFNQGLLDACAFYNCSLIGGDTVASPGGYSFTITILGEMEDKDVLYRRGALAGDTIYMSGRPGLAAGGLALLSAGFSADDTRFSELFVRHLNPEARLQLGRRLAARGLVHAMMDSSDGLATDLAHICTASQLGARIFSQRLHIPPALQEAAELCKADPLDWILRGGEDFELIFTAPPQAEAALFNLAQDCAVPIQAIGLMDEDDGAGLRLVLEQAADEGAGGRSEISLSYQGYDHFLQPRKD